MGLCSAINSRVRRLAVVSGVAAVAALGALAPVSAVTPDSFTFDFRDSFTDTEVCAGEPWGFDVQATQHGYGTVRGFYQDGEIVRVIVHLNLDFTITANGITLTERDQITTIFTPDGRRDVGLSTHIQGPRGVVLVDAGQLVFAPDGTFLYGRGRHPQFFGASFCDALVP